MLQREVLSGPITYQQSWAILQHLAQRKKRAFLAKLEHDIYRLLLSQDPCEAWRLFHKHSSPIAITSKKTWTQYASSLYMIPCQPSLPEPLEPYPQTCASFIAEMVRKAIDDMRNGKAYDHAWLVAQYFIHARDMLVELLAMMFNRAIGEGMLHSWSLSTVVPIFNTRDPIEPRNYRIFKVGHTLA